MTARGAIPLAEYLAQGTDTEMWALPGLLARGGFVACVGAPESFKTFGGFTLLLGFSEAVPDFLGCSPTERMPVVYVSNEKSTAMVRSRLRRMTSDGRTPKEPFSVLHRQGVEFGSSSWGLVTDELARLGRPALVLLDTAASLSRPGFDENSGKDTSVILKCIRELQDGGATVVLNVHPSKYAQGPAGAKVRGHTSLWGEADAIWEYQRPDRASDAGLLIADVKDGERLLLPFQWNSETFLVEPGKQLLLTSRSVTAVVLGLWRGEPLRSSAIIKAFAPHHGRTAVLNQLAEAVRSGAVGSRGKGNATRYHPLGGISNADEPPRPQSGLGTDE